VIAMTHVGYLVAGYSITFAAIGGYVTWLTVRSRAVARQLNDDKPPGSTP
jgi:CcmD family protein